MSAFTKPLAQARQNVEHLRLAGRTSYELKQWCDNVLAALDRVEQLATEQEELLARILDHADAGYQEHQARRSAYLSASGTTEGVAREEGADTR